MSADPARRGVLRAGLVGTTGLAAALTAGCRADDAGTSTGATATAVPAPDAITQAGRSSVAYRGVHQPGLTTAPQAHVRLLALDLRPDAGADGLRRLLHLVGDDARRLMAGTAPLADTQPELTLAPSGLTVTVGLGPSVFDLPGLADRRPAALRELPAFDGDRLQARFSGGDVLLQVGGDDPVTLSHAVRTLLKDVRPWAVVRWHQPGFTRARGTAAVGATGRNLLGQVDGTVNPVPGTPAFEAAIWSPRTTGPTAWFAGGTLAVVRRVRLNLETWDAFDRAGRELVIGRRLSDGAPLTGGGERTAVDLDAVDAQGLPVVPAEAHVRLARARTTAESLLRRPFNYDDGPDAEGVTDAGLLFVAFTADPWASFVPVQRRLAASDALNRWATHVGSAVFAVPPGALDEEDWVGRSLFT